MKLALSLLMAVVIGLSFTPAMAQDVELEEEFGLGDQVTWLNPWDFESALDFGLIVVDLNDYGYFNFIERFSLIPPGQWAAPIHLPDNARLVRAALYGYDSSLIFDIEFNVLRDNPVTHFRQQMFVGSGPIFSSGNGGYQVISAPINKKINNRNNIYWAWINLDVIAGFEGVNLGDHRHRFTGVKLTWRREISDPPASHTFWDVTPGDDFYKEIEALVGAGITLGCDAHNYCPDKPMTRGQMAAMFARALGL